MGTLGTWKGSEHCTHQDMNQDTLGLWIECSTAWAAPSVPPVHQALEKWRRFWRVRSLDGSSEQSFLSFQQKLMFVFKFSSGGGSGSGSIEKGKKKMKKWERFESNDEIFFSLAWSNSWLMSQPTARSVQLCYLIIIINTYLKHNKNNQIWVKLKTFCLNWRMAKLSS